MNTTFLRMGRPRLSQELIDLTLDFLRDDREALRQCTLASRSFQIPAQKVLFECIKLKPIPAVKSTEAEEERVQSEPVATSTSPSQAPPLPTNMTTTMAQRLHNLLNSSPHLAGLIKDLRIRDMDDFNYEQPRSVSWLKDDTSLPQILPLLTNLQRLFLAGSMSDSMLDMATLPQGIKNALLEVWRKSNKITHIGFQCVKFSSFRELLEVVEGCAGVKHMTFFAVDADDLSDASSLENVDVNLTVAVGTPSPDITPGGRSEVSSTDTGTKKTIHAIESLGLFLEPELLSRFCAWLLGPSSKLGLSSLQKLSLVAELKDNLKLVRRVVEASTSLEEMRITIISGDETSQTEPFDISTLRVVHLGIDFDVSEPTHCPETTLNWWCDNLTSSSSSTLALQDFNIYILTDYDRIPEIQYNHPGWKRLDEILSAGERLVNLRVQIKCLEDDDEFEGGWSPSLVGDQDGTNRIIAPAELKKLEDVFPRMRDKGRLVVSQMKESIFSHLGVYWAQ
ncbi:hypothetical protein L218DRAFT_1080295 [Marasmius fiardii PR-910]|nr:hypothetical protein L218DRAFT_1080295 [Marasmius fiardii PR-910]